MNPLISVILTVCNEGEIIENSVSIISSILNQITSNYEIIIVNDGSTDNSKKICENITINYKNTKYIHREKNMGRGFSVKQGILKSKGKFVGFIDTDLELNPKYIPLFITELNKGNDLVTYKRIYKIKNVRDYIRYLAGKGYSTLVKIILWTKVTDSETGFKFFKKEKILPILKLTKDNRWFFDTEIMVLSDRKKLKIKEIPLPYSQNKKHGSAVNVIRDSLRYLIRLIQFRFRI